MRVKASVAGLAAEGTGPNWPSRAAGPDGRGAGVPEDLDSLYSDEIIDPTRRGSCRTHRSRAGLRSWQRPDS